ncbi:zinc finger protein 592 [Takifugu flavidus]|uniref:Zinc finger protein 592 n=1 Tax=Takifugu flavidus TaxID=433684 RepID=A0A5C6PDN4_9TELE|nr:zinc finger protein 592 [Takifugu flavidus]TWW76330.1 Zinc finger protein 592 [Takifugu flavidus]
MGDMKTPDFDDLLAAFDIPDATGLDAKEPIQGSHEETEIQLKHVGMCLDDSLLSSQAVSTTDIPTVSVIVKNTSRQDLLEGFGSPLHNGFKGQDSSIDPAEPANDSFSKSFISALNGESSRELLGKAPIQHKPDGTPVFTQSLSHFSPVSSPDSENTLCNRDEMHPKESPCFPEASVLVEPSVSDNPQKLDPSILHDRTVDSQIPKESQGGKKESRRREEMSNILVSNESDQIPRTHSAIPQQGAKKNPNEIKSESGSSSEPPVPYPQKPQTSKLSSCLEALVALNARKDLKEPAEGLKASPSVPISPRSPRSPREAVKRLMKPSDSPVSICSDSSGKASPALMSGSPPAIPRVRIKTIKTTSGQIKRTVTSVLPDSETDEVPSAYESSPAPSMISEDSYCNMSPYQSQSASVDGPAVPKGTAATPAAKVSHGKLEANPRKLGAKLSGAAFRASAGPVKQPGPHHRQKPKRGSAPGGRATNAGFLPKAMHLASLNLVPHSVAASVAARTTPPQPGQRSLSSTVYSTVPLVHQVQTSQAHTCTNTASATLNRLLNHANPVPTYVPNLSPPPESDIRLPARGYCCLECGDSFGVERSLAHHYGRRSVHIEVGCTHCAKTIVFFNKCALLAHAREHKSGGAVMQCTQLHMRPIPEEHMFAPLDAEPASSDSPAAPSPPQRVQAVLPLHPDNVIRHRLRCLECNKQVPDYKALAGHYQRPSENVEGLMCDTCTMLLPNKCSFRAHERIHAHKSPYCCPECGALSRSADIQKHVKENCLHYARKAWYKCLHCDMVFKTLQGQKMHIEEKHCEVFYKCSVCPVAFKTADSCEVHLNKKHNTSKVSPQIIFKCSCETVFKKKQLLLEHFHQNASKRVTSVFKCPECNSVFPQKHLLMQHFKSVHIGNMTAEAENGNVRKNGKEWRHRVQKKSHDPMKQVDGSKRRAEQDSRAGAKSSGWTCGVCLQWFPERDSYVSHVKTAHTKLVKKYPCRHCEQSFNSRNVLRRHNRTAHDGKAKTYTCWYCTDTKTTFATSMMLKNHVRLMHGIKNPDVGQMSRTFNQEAKKPLGHVSERPPGAPREEERDPTPNLGAPSAKRLKAQLRCSKCGFVTGDSAQFQRHIPQHKSDESTPQCLRCGLCFTSALSLSRHLHIVHKVKEVKEERGAAVAAARETPRDPQPDAPAGVERVDDSLPKRNEPDRPDRKENSEHRSSRTDAAAPPWRETPPSSANR